MDETAAAPSRGRRPAALWGLVILSVLVVGGVAAWSASLRTQSLGIGDEVAHEGGVVVVSAAWGMDDPMRLMHPDDPDKFAASGMPMMSAMMSDAIPEGFKRVAVEVQLSAGGTAMTFPVEGVSLAADGISYRVYSSMLQDGELSSGHALDAVAVFEVPIEIGVAEFRLAPSAPAITVDVSGGGHVDHPDDEP